MGLGLRLTAKAPRRRLLPLRLGVEAVVRRVSDASFQLAAQYGEPLLRWRTTHLGDSTLSVCLVPHAQNVELQIGKEGIVCSAKTSSVGPGYHALVVELLDGLSDALGVTWRADEEGGDDTGYFEHRDFATLQAEMARWLYGLAGLLGERAARGRTGFVLDLPFDDVPHLRTFAASVLGEWTREWFLSLQQTHGGALFERCAEFFPWWDRGLTVATLEKLALATCWVDVPWTAPRTRGERDAYQSAIACIERARASGGAASLGAVEADLRRLIDADGEEEPADTGIGFRRRTMTRPLTGRWTIDLPGYFHGRLEHDGSERVYSFRDRTVRARSERFRPRGESPETVLRRVSPVHDPVPLPLAAEHLAGHFGTEWSDAEHRFLMHASIVKADGACHLTIGFARETEGEWARNLA
ncbi:MAG: hypothetical protein ACODAG_07640, partial [Myxococcota bacterium]